MNVLVTLLSGQGVDLGPNFNLTANVGSVTPSTATLIQLLAGKSVVANDSATQLTITSTGACTNSLNLAIL
jgi:predicted amino acid racemase